MTGGPWPGHAVVDRETEQACNQLSRIHTGAEGDSSRFYVSSYGVRQDNWSHGDRLIVCTLEFSDFVTDRLRDLSGTG